MHGMYKKEKNRARSSWDFVIRDGEEKRRGTI